MIKKGFNPESLIRKYNALSQKDKVRHCPTGFSKEELKKMHSKELVLLRNTTAEYLMTKSQICQNKLFFFLIARINSELKERRTGVLQSSESTSMSSAGRERKKLRIESSNGLTINGRNHIEDFPCFLNDKVEETIEEDLSLKESNADSLTIEAIDLEFESEEFSDNFFLGRKRPRDFLLTLI